MFNITRNQSPHHLSVTAFVPKGGASLKLGVLGASGRTGTEVVRQALDDGHQVTVLVRDPAKLGEFKDRVQVIQGDAMDVGSCFG